MELDSNEPTGPIEKRWEKHRFDMKLVNPANKRKYTIIMVGTGLAGGAAAATMGELGYNVKAFCYQDSPRRAHSIAAQGGINAAKNYQNDGDSVYRLFYDTVKGGDFRSRESNVYRLAQVGVNIIDQASPRACPSPASTAASWPTAPSAAPRSRAPSTRAGRPASSCSSAPTRRSEDQIAAGKVEIYTRTEMLDLIVIDGSRAASSSATCSRARSRPTSGTAWSSPAAATATSSTSPPTPRAATSQPTWRAHRHGALFANPCYTQIHPTCIPPSRRLPVQAHADERVAPQRRAGVGAEERRRLQQGAARHRRSGP